MTLTVDGRTIDAVAEVSKQGFTYVFDRVTGEPVWPIEERPVPQSDVPGEKTSPTQPHPTRPAAYERQGFSEDDRGAFNVGAQVDFRFTVSNRYDMTLSLGYAVGYLDSTREDEEFMVSLKIL